MTERHRILECAERLARAIGQRDLAQVRAMLAPGFVHRTRGADARDTEGFLAAIEQIPGEILFVALEQVAIDLTPRGALVTGVQHAQVRIEGGLVEDRRGFVDWFIEDGGEWRVQAAVDFAA